MAGGVPKAVSGANLVRLSSNEDVVRRALVNFTKNLAPEATDQAIRKVAADVINEVATGLSGSVSGVPQRVDTGRLRAGWGMAGRKMQISTRTKWRMKGQRANSAIRIPKSAASQTNDGSVNVSGRKQDRSIEVSNNVEYAVYVETGTVHMQPGNHLVRALGVVAQDIPNGEMSKDLDDDIQAAWEGA